MLEPLELMKITLRGLHKQHASCSRFQPVFAVPWFPSTGGGGGGRGGAGGARHAVAPRRADTAGKQRTIKTIEQCVPCGIQPIPLVIVMLLLTQGQVRWTRLGSVAANWWISCKLGGVDQLHRSEGAADVRLIKRGRPLGREGEPNRATLFKWCVFNLLQYKVGYTQTTSHIQHIFSLLAVIQQRHPQVN